ncbi:MAG: hypothetical protein ACP5LI_08070, partial [Hydrogenobaculum sp.]
MKGIFCKDVIQENEELKNKLEMLEKEKQELAKRYEDATYKYQRLEEELKSLKQENQSYKEKFETLEKEKYKNE